MQSVFVIAPIDFLPGALRGIENNRCKGRVFSHSDTAMLPDTVSGSSATIGSSSTRADHPPFSGSTEMPRFQLQGTG
jgi:hypothetical protein